MKPDTCSTSISPSGFEVTHWICAFDEEEKTFVCNFCVDMGINKCSFLVPGIVRHSSNLSARFFFSVKYSSVLQYSKVMAEILLDAH